MAAECRRKFWAFYNGKSTREKESMGFLWGSFYRIFASRNHSWHVLTGGLYGIRDIPKSISMGGGACSRPRLFGKASIGLSHAGDPKNLGHPQGHRVKFLWALKDDIECSEGLKGGQHYLKGSRWAPEFEKYLQYLFIFHWLQKYIIVALVEIEVLRRGHHNIVDNGWLKMEGWALRENLMCWQMFVATQFFLLFFKACFEYIWSSNIFSLFIFGSTLVSSVFFSRY